ncbi:hypothetical protein OPT61_g10618 [Boeremia exigua]|uniref:Uncharacterized protein n=1 Tax=Boeremia exigua TaxID=749465 RepID=A0ACC2HP75_9PLEO|nr:hypothetical protein OPT61_g10618 [Boeremia exigua]
MEKKQMKEFMNLMAADVLQPRPAVLRLVRQRLREQVAHLARGGLRHAMRRQAHEGLAAPGRERSSRDGGAPHERKEDCRFGMHERSRNGEAAGLDPIEFHSFRKLWLCRTGQLDEEVMGQAFAIGTTSPASPCLPALLQPAATIPYLTQLDRTCLHHKQSNPQIHSTSFEHTPSLHHQQQINTQSPWVFSGLSSGAEGTAAAESSLTGMVSAVLPSGFPAAASPASARRFLTLTMLRTIPPSKHRRDRQHRHSKMRSILIINPNSTVSMTDGLRPLVDALQFKDVNSTAHPASQQLTAARPPTPTSPPPTA